MRNNTLYILKRNNLHQWSQPITRKLWITESNEVNPSSTDIDTDSNPNFNKNQTDSIPKTLKKNLNFSHNFKEEKSPFGKNRMAEEPQIQPEWPWRTQEEMSEAREEDDDERQRRNDGETEEQDDSGDEEEQRGYEDYGFSTVKQRFEEASRNSGIWFDFRHSRPFGDLDFSVEEKKFWCFKFFFLQLRNRTGYV